MEELLMLGIFLGVLWLCCLYLDWLLKNKNRCIEGNHDWIFQRNSKGNTGDLGFGIKGFWNTNHYRCSKCGKEKEEEIY